MYLRQAGSLLPLGEEGSVSQAGSQAVTFQPGPHLPPMEGSSSAASQAGSQASQAFQAGRPVTSPSLQEKGRLVASPASQKGVHLPPAGENSSQAGNNFPISQAGSQGIRSGRQNPRCSARQRALQASQGNSTASQAYSGGPQEGNLTPNPPNRLHQGSSLEDPNPKWAMNLSNKPLTPAQRSVLAKGPNFVVAPKQPPNLEYITAIEAVCTKLSQQDAEELRAEVNRVLRSSHPPKPNLTKAQNLA